MDRDGWQQLLTAEETKLQFSQGFKFLYGPWSSRAGLEVAFLSLNPGRAPPFAELRTVSDERGNSYLIEASTTVSPLTQQFLTFAARVASPPEAILTGVVAPFRTDDWKGASLAQRRAMLSLGRSFWREPLIDARLRLIVAVSDEAAALAVELTGAKFDGKRPAGWGDLVIRRYRLPNGGVIAHLPHLSRFRLFGRPQSEDALDWALEKPSSPQSTTITRTRPVMPLAAAIVANGSPAVDDLSKERSLPAAEKAMLLRIRGSRGYFVKVLEMQSVVFLDGAKVGGLNRKLVEWYVSKLFVAKCGGPAPLERRGFHRIDKGEHVYWAAKGPGAAESFAAAVTEMTGCPIQP
ncbi:MAG: hypothetical protein WAT35_15135 [Tabrizicola sp.]|jgi:hypothetical protein|uniref:hypothetical protein n=1 Tax=Tabrizicola sp. TaxID=2005166 RepID=UPI001B60FC6F|nr:hypothetical protein [Tabrizicola sp.]